VVDVGSLDELGHEQGVIAVRANKLLQARPALIQLVNHHRCWLQHLLQLILSPKQVVEFCVLLVFVRLTLFGGYSVRVLDCPRSAFDAEDQSASSPRPYPCLH
jgi:hypothetical protein